MSDKTTINVPLDEMDRIRLEPLQRERKELAVKLQQIQQQLTFLVSEQSKVIGAIETLERLIADVCDPFKIKYSVGSDKYTIDDENWAIVKEVEVGADHQPD